MNWLYILHRVGVLVPILIVSWFIHRKSNRSSADGWDNFILHLTGYILASVFYFWAWDLFIGNVPDVHLPAARLSWFQAHTCEAAICLAIYLPARLMGRRVGLPDIAFLWVAVLLGGTISDITIGNIEY